MLETCYLGGKGTEFYLLRKITPEKQVCSSWQQQSLCLHTLTPDTDELPLSRSRGRKAIRKYVEV